MLLCQSLSALVHICEAAEGANVSWLQKGLGVNKFILIPHHMCLMTKSSMVRSDDKD